MVLTTRFIQLSVVCIRLVRDRVLLNDWSERFFAHYEQNWSEHRAPLNADVAMVGCECLLLISPVLVLLER